MLLKINELTRLISSLLCIVMLTTSTLSLSAPKKDQKTDQKEEEEEDDGPPLLIDPQDDAHSANQDASLHDSFDPFPPRRAIVTVPAEMFVLIGSFLQYSELLNFACLGRYFCKVFTVTFSLPT